MLALFDQLDSQGLTPDVVVYNVGAYIRGAITNIDLEDTKHVLLSNAFGAIAVAQEAAKRMTLNNSGVMLFTGASAGVKGYAQSAPFAMGKFALRGLCQSLARELSPQNIHVAHFVIDGLIYSEERGAPYNDKSKTMHPDQIAKSYFHIAHQHSSAWTWEVELRSYLENF